MKKLKLALIIILALIFVVIAIVYFTTSAGSLPHFFPGHEAGSKTVHIKHGIAAIILAVALGLLAWFSGGSRPTSTTDT